MNELITVDNGVALLDADASHLIAEFERVIADLKEKEETFRQQILDEMEKKGIKKLETDEITVTYKASYDREKFDSKQFRADHADLYDDYVSMSPVKPSITIKLKEEKA